MNLHTGESRNTLTIASALSWFNVGLRGVMEFGVIAAMAYWGYQTGTSHFIKLVFAVLAPVIAFGFWGLVDFHNAGSHAELLRLVQELLITGIAALALFNAGQHILAWIFGIISILHHSLVYLLGQTLLKKGK